MRRLLGVGPTRESYILDACIRESMWPIASAGCNQPWSYCLQGIMSLLAVQIRRIVHICFLCCCTVIPPSEFRRWIQLRFDFDSTAVRRAFDYERSLRSQRRNSGHWPASRSHTDLLIYLGLRQQPPLPHTQWYTRV